MIAIAAVGYIVGGLVPTDPALGYPTERLTGGMIIVLAFAAGIAYRLDTLGVWRPAAAGLLEQLSLMIGYAWVVAVAARFLLSRRQGRASVTGPAAAGPSSGP